MKEKILRHKNGVEIREGCVVRTKALTLDSRRVRSYENFKVVRIDGRLCVQKRISDENIRTFGVAYILRWLKDESMEVVETPPE